MINQDRLPLTEPLTDRELEVLGLMSTGSSNREIADSLVISVETVRWYTKQIYSKLGTHSRTQTILYAQSIGILEENSPTQKIEMPREALHNLPLYSLKFIGREEESAELERMLLDKSIRLITVLGPGGIGKTRLCVEVCHRIIDSFDDGIFFVAVSNIISAEDIYKVIVRSLNLHIDSNLEKRLLQYLQDKDMLLIFDSFEHLLDGAEQLTKILTHTNKISLLVTSRSLLNLRMEWVLHLAGLVTDAHASSQSSAIQLFVERAQRVRHDFSLQDNMECVIDICNLTDGMPLAIELAAIWVKSLRCQDIAREIRQTIDFLVTRNRDSNERHRSVRAVIDYSWQALSEEERRMMQRLIVFRGGFGFKAAQLVAGISPQQMADLMDKSLVNQQSDGTYGIHNLLRQYIEHRLEISATEGLSTRSTMILTWLSLMKGDLDKAKEVADDILRRKVDAHNVVEQAVGFALIGIVAGIDGDYEQCHQLCDASFNLILQDPSFQDPITSIFANIGLSIAACGLQDYHAVQHHILVAINIASTFEIPVFIVMCLPIVAIWFAHQVERVQAVELLSLAFNHATSKSNWMQNWLLLRELQHDLQSELGIAAYDEIWQAGKSQDLGAVVKMLQRELADI